jgi:hypothetical protein
MVALPLGRAGLQAGLASAAARNPTRGVTLDPARVCPTAPRGSGS